ncbi:MAG: translocation/assembly module TamB domain-containing protein [Candidatus Zixiibacteriota bacterium]
MRTFAKIILTVLIGIVLLAGSLYLYLFQFGGVEKIVNKQLASAFATRYNLDIIIGSISGDLLSGIILENVLVYYVDSTHRNLILNLPRISAVYALSNLWKKNYIFDQVYIDSAAITLSYDSTGRWLFPPISSVSASRESSAPSFLINDLRINDASLTLFGAADTLGFGNINLAASIEGREKTYSIDLRLLELTSLKNDIDVSAPGGKVTYSEGNVVFKDIEAVINETRVKLAGRAKLKDIITGQVDFAFDNVKLAEVSDLLGISLTGRLDMNGTVSFTGKEMQGSVIVAGEFMLGSFENLWVGFRFDSRHLELDTLYGTILDNCTIDGSGEIDFSPPVERYHLTAAIKNFNLERLIANTFESDLTGRIELSGESFRSDRLLLKLHTELHESSFDEYPLHEVSGDLLITTDSICFADSFRINYFENVFYLSGRIDYKNDIDLSIMADLHNLDRYRGKLFIAQTGGRGHMETILSGATADPDLTGSFVSDSVWVYGLYSTNFTASVDIKRFLTGKQGTIKVSCYNGTAWEIPYDSGYAVLTIDSTIVQIDTSCFHNQYSQLYSRGIVDYSVYPLYVNIDTLTLFLFDQSFFNRANIEFEIDSLGFNFRKAVIGNNGAVLALGGHIGYDQSMDALLSVDNVPVKPWLHLFDTSLTIDGNISCEAFLKGTFREPQFTLAGSIDSLIFRGLNLGTLTAGIRYRYRMIMLDSLIVRSAEGVYKGNGTFHANLAFSSSVAERFPDLPLSVHITATDRTFDLISLLMPSVEQLDGEFFADIALSGTPRAPHLEGQAYLKKARLKYFDIVQPFYADSAGVTMVDNRIAINRIEVYTTDKEKGGKRRYAYIEGDIIVKSLDLLSYNLDISFPKEFPFTYELDDIRGVVEGKLHIEGDSPPLVTGDITIISARYQVNFATEQEGSPVMTALAGENTWDLNINIDVLSNYWIKNDDIDAEFAGQVNLIRENGVYRFIGELEILRGRGFLFDKTFQLEHGSRVIFEGDPSINPRLDIIGHTRIAGVRRSFGEEPETAQPLDLGIHVTGTLEEPEINPVEGSEFNREDILPLIVANYYSSDSIASSTQIEHRLSGLVSSQVSQIGSKQLARLGVETFEIDHLYGEKYDPLKARVTAGFYAAPNLYVYGRSTLSGEARREVGFEYRFNKAFLLEGLRDEEELYHLALKLHWEF